MEYKYDIILHYKCNNEELIQLNLLLERNNITEKTGSIKITKEQLILLKKKEFKEELSIKTIKNVVNNYYKAEDSDTNNSKKNKIFIRQISHYLAKKYTTKSLAKIGSEIGNKNHATVLYSKRKIEDLLSIYKNIQIDINNIEQILISKLKQNDKTN